MSKLVSTNVEDILALTPMQIFMLFRYLGNPESRQYHECFRYKLRGNIDPGLLQESLDLVVDSNEMLRTVFRWADLKKPVQIVLRNQRLIIKSFVLDGEDEEEKQEQADAIYENCIGKKIDISQHPIKISLIKFSKDHYEMLVYYHHILFDGWSNSIFLRELSETYKALYAKTAPPEIRKSRYKNFIKWLRKKDKSKARQFWKSYLKDAGKTNTSPFGEKPRAGTEEELSYEYQLDQILATEIDKFLKRNGNTLAVLLFSAWGIFLHKLTQENDVIFGIALSGRPDEVKDVDRLIGLFINTLPLRVKIHPDNNVDALLDGVARMLREIGEYEYIPLMEILDNSGLTQKGKLFNTILVIQNYPLDMSFFNDNGFNLTFHSMEYKTGMDLALSFRTFEGIVLNATYNANLFNSSDMKKIIEYLIAVIQYIVRDNELAPDGQNSKKVRDIEPADGIERRIMEEIRSTSHSLDQIEEFDFNF